MKSFLDSKALRYLLYCLAVLPLFLFRDFTLDNELRYLSIADEAIRNGSFFTFTNHGIIYADKPPLYLWIVMLGKWLLGSHSMVFLALFSFLPALVIIHTMDQWINEALSQTERILGELLLLTSAFFIGSAIVMRMDMLMCMFIVLALYIFYRMYQGKARRWDSLLFPLLVFMALFTKGPLGLIIPLVSTLVFLFIKNEVRSIGRYWGVKTWAILLAFCALWLLGVYSEGGDKYLQDLVYNQTVNRAVHSFHHSEPFYYYLIAIWYSLAPWSLLLVGILVMGIQQKLFYTDLELFFLVIILSTLAILSLISSKLEIYLIPSFPFIIYLGVLWLKRLQSPRWATLLVMIPALLICLALPVAAIWQFYDHSFSVPFSLAALSLSLTGILTLAYLRKHALNRGIISMGTGLLVFVFVVSLAVPQYNSLIGMGELCQKAQSISAAKGVKNYYFTHIPRADNLDVYLGIKPVGLSIKDLYHPGDKIKTPAILFLSERMINHNDSIRQFIKDKKKHQVGKYFCVE
ncbi:MAG: glycosyltransferase family 39 protein, partial [Verrucomicrobia bacterium]|nr:glycosyltransferase family 39 protein [Prolixibacteraceae bacterium]